MNLNIENWTSFRLGDIFDIKKGKRLTSEDQTIGNTPYIGAIDSNNGIANYIGQSPTHNGNTITLSYNGSVGEAFYQPNAFWATDDVNVLYFKKENGVEFNEHIALFICAVLKKEKYRYCYGRKWVLESMNETRIKLPTKNNVPDWEWMETYIKSLHHKPITTKISNKNNVTLKSNEWKEFYLHKLFNAGMGNGIDAVLTTNDNPKYNYVSRKSDSDFDFVDEIEGETPFPAGSMTLALGGSLGSCFIHSKPFYTAQNVAVLQEKTPLSNHTKLFIATLIRNECKIKYQAFGRELNAHFRKDFTIKLPIKRDANGIIYDETHEFSDDGYIPDWEWMDSYMKSLPYSDRI
ncbi:MAG: restriction endonuclease subunit S [Fibrobacteraceae bacterium]|nr:restriction endonuclease subunit S [Fibrobacteraceae bacterium]